jgi:peptide/nickel transport system permease protein
MTISNSSIRTKIEDLKRANESRIKELKFMMSKIRQNPLSLFGLYIIIFYFLVAILAPFLAPPNPGWDNLQNPNPFIIPRPTNKFDPVSPSRIHPFGLTVQQYDIFYGCIWGTVNAFRVGVYTIAISLLIGVTVGLLAGYYEGIIGEALMRFTDIIMAFPSLVLAIAFAISIPELLTLSMSNLTLILSVFLAPYAMRNFLKRAEITRNRSMVFLIGAIICITLYFTIFTSLIPNYSLFSIRISRLDKVILALVIVGWPGYARLVRGEVLRVKNEGYVEAARADGFGDFSIIYRHVVPNSIYPILILASLDIGIVVLLAAGLSFLGLGAETNFADWGQLVQKSQNFMGSALSLLKYWYIWAIPGAFIFTFCLGWNLLGDAIRDILDPTLRRR